MRFTVNDYADFVTILHDIGAVRAIYYYSATGVFWVYAIIADGQLMPIYDAHSAPTTFATDFPSAVQLNSLLYFSGSYT